MRCLLPVLLAATLAAQSPANTEVRNPATTPADAAAGAKTFRSHCSECHGLNGDGGRGPNLASGVYYHGSSDAELLRNISDGIAGTEMPGLFYSPDRVWQVVTYLRSLNRRDPVPGDADAGQRVFAAKGCAKCHRIDGAGGRLGPDLSWIGRARSANHIRAAVVDPNADVRQRYWFASARDKQGRAVEGFVMNEDTWSVQLMDLNERLHSVDKAGLARYKVEKTSKMPSYRGQIAGADLTNLVAYLATRKPKGGSQ